MTVHIHRLRGCAPTPLAHYLKALGVFRVVAEQRDQTARAFWRDDAFHLVTGLDESELLRFICDEFELTPLIAPWNGGSGFYPKDAREGIDAISASTASRLDSYRRAIAMARRQIGTRTERPEKDEKSALLADCARTWDERALGWFCAAVGLSNDGAGRYPALLGTGGNDGRLEFTNNAMQRWMELIDATTGRARDSARALARGALFGEAYTGLVSVAVGQFLPGGAGGANSGSGFDSQSQVNPWDFVMMLEGAVALRVAALRRLDGRELPQAAAPFALRGLAVAYASAAADDDSGRGEQWLPLWSAPTTFPELSRVFAEGRIVRGTHRTEGALDAARAVAQYGVARGIGSFVRFGFMERNGLSNLAIPLSRVASESAPSVRLLDQIDEWLDALRRAAGADHAPESFGRALRKLQGTMFDIATRATATASWSDLLEQLGSIEDLFVRSRRFSAERSLRPVPMLTEAWLDSADDGSVEFRLAVSLASVRGPDPRRDLDPIRANCIPLDPATRYRRFLVAGEGLRLDARVVWDGHDLTDDLSAVVLRRAIDGQGATSGLPMCGSAFARLDDVSAFIVGDVDDGRISRLARGLMCVDARPKRAEGGRAYPLYALFRAAALDASEGTRAQLLAGASARVDMQTLRLLDAGRIGDAARVAATRLTAMGYRAKMRGVAGAPSVARRILASLAFPISPLSVRHVLDVVARPFERNELETP
ncbi:hypothetical protein BH09MYX1_BH09MYX1_36710 [soil metagenome]